MTPREFLAHVSDAARAAAPASSSVRAYAAVTRSAVAEHFLTLHKEGKFQAYPYGSLLLIGGDARGGTLITINHPTWLIRIEGSQLGAVFEALRTRTAAHLHEFSDADHDRPEAGEPVITQIAFGISSGKAAGDAGTA